MDEVKRILEIGRLLRSVLTPEEIEILKLLAGNDAARQIMDLPDHSKISNAGIT